MLGHGPILPGAVPAADSAANATRRAEHVREPGRLPHEVVIANQVSDPLGVGIPLPCQGAFERGNAVLRGAPLERADHSVEPQVASGPPRALDIVVPVHNEGASIRRMLDALVRHVKTPFRVLICFDFDEDDTLPALSAYGSERCAIALVKNRDEGPLAAVVAGFAAATAPAVLTMPADDDYNAPIIDALVEAFRAGHDIVCPSRFAPGGSVSGYPWLKASLVRSAAWLLKYLARLPTSDPTNGFRLYSRRVIAALPIESTQGHAYSLELLVKAHRLGWRIGEVPAQWFERRCGKSRFRVLRWLPTYLSWVGYALATTLLRRGPRTVRLRDGTPADDR